VPEPVYLLVEMPPGFTVTEDLLGTEWPVGDGASSLRFPRLPPLPTYDGSPARLGQDLAPPDLGAAAAAIEERWGRWLADDDSPHEVGWGALTLASQEPGGHRVLHADVERAAAVCRYMGPNDPEARTSFLNNGGEALDAWLGEVALWLDMLRGKVIPTAFTPRRQPPTVVRAGALVADPEARPDGVARFGLFHDPGEYRTIHVQRGVTRDEWAAAVARVGTESPLAHAMLRQARLAQRDGDWRRAVIDAATACEVALAEAIRSPLTDRLAGDDPEALSTDEVEKLIDRRRSGLMDLYDFRVAAVGPIASVSWGKLNDRLAGVRNRVVHKGHPPTQQQVSAALTVADALVAEVAPLLAP
jgi:hypothetical protein